MRHSEKTIPEMSIIGIELHTDNSEAGIKKIGEHWQRLHAEHIFKKIPNTKSNNVFALYTDYEGGQRGSYSLILGAEVTNTDSVPEEMVVKKLPIQKYAVFTAKGTMPQALIETWQEIWKSGIARKFSSDFELYDEKSNRGDQSEVSVHIAIS
jgi:predicted transcriptional regulator YdeE